mgnify:FL=1|tara:strand:+ start:648 stop:827 length:180 start_codon:yes stop_codon:yes gene_type:complete
MKEIDPDLEYANENNIFKSDQNAEEWTEMFIRMRDKYGAVQPDPITGLGVSYGNGRAHS